MSFELRLANASDAGVLSAFAEETFRLTFSRYNDPADMDLYVRSAFSSEKQLAEILDPSRRTLLAFAGDRLAGYYHLGFGKNHLSKVAPQAVELIRFYVHQDFHGLGLAHLMMEHVLTYCREHGFEQTWLGVWENNARARAFYRKWGFEEVGSHPFYLGNDAQRDLLLAKVLATADTRISRFDNSESAKVYS